MLSLIYPGWWLCEENAVVVICYTVSYKTEQIIFKLVLTVFGTPF